MKENKPETFVKFCPMHQPLGMAMPQAVQGAAPRVQLQFIPCQGDKCMVYDPLTKDCRMAFLPKSTAGLPQAAKEPSAP